MNIKLLLLFGVMSLIGMVLVIYGFIIQNDSLGGIGIVLFVQGLIGKLIIILRSE